MVKFNDLCKANTLTMTQLVKAMQKHPYIFVRTTVGENFSLNCKALLRDPKTKEVRETIVWAYKPVSFHEYISTKLPFIKS